VQRGVAEEIACHADLSGLGDGDRGRRTVAEQMRVYHVPEGCPGPRRDGSIDGVTPQATAFPTGPQGAMRARLRKLRPLGIRDCELTYSPVTRPERARQGFSGATRSGMGAACHSRESDR
jgi:hypothetical protein